MSGKEMRADTREWESRYVTDSERIGENEIEANAS
jgi:hypothetical protein